MMHSRVDDAAKSGGKTIECLSTVRTFDVVFQSPDFFEQVHHAHCCSEIGQLLDVCTMYQLFLTANKVLVRQSYQCCLCGSRQPGDEQGAFERWKLGPLVTTL